MKKLICSFLFGALFAINFTNGQGERVPSPSVKIVQKVGLTDITLEYSRPGIKERTIFSAEGLVPFGKLWRTGANAATKITFSDAVKIGDGELDAGSYAILTKPNAEIWEIHFYPYSATRWSSYRDGEPSVKIMATPKKTTHSFESFLIYIDNIRDYSASIEFAWENTIVSLPIGVK